MKFQESKDETVRNIIKNGGEIKGALEYFIAFKKKHPTYKTMIAEHNKHFKIGTPLEK